MAVPDPAIISLEELNRALGGQDSDSGPIDEQKQEIITRRSEEVEAFLDRQIVTRTDDDDDDTFLVEYHTPRAGQTELYLGQWPVREVVSVHEDIGWASVVSASRYPASTLLTPDVHYIVIAPSSGPAPFGKLLRLSGTWACGRRVIKVVYSAGYANTEAVPGPIKAVTADLCAIAWREQSRKEWGLASRSDASGSVSRFVPALLTAKHQAQLLAYKRIDFAPTWERDAA